jgi:hypothetical protein
MGVAKRKKGCFPSTMRALANVKTGDGSQHKSGFLPTSQIQGKKSALAMVIGYLIN